MCKVVTAMSKLKINGQLLPMKAYYFLWYAGLVSGFPFVVVYAKQLGFSGFMIGVVYAILPIGKMILNPLMGSVADKYKNQKTIFIITQLVSACGIFSLVFLPALPKHHPITFVCNSNGTALTIQSSSNCNEHLFTDVKDGIVSCNLNCPLLPEKWRELHNLNNNTFEVHMPTNTLKSFDKQLQLTVSHILPNDTKFTPYCTNNTAMSTECNAHCDLLALNELISRPKVPDTDIYAYYQFWYLLLSFFTYIAGNALCCCIADTICFQILGEERRKYGFQKMFSSVGWGGFAVIAGFLIDAYSVDKTQKNHTPSFLMAFGIALLSALVSCKLHCAQQPHKANMVKDIKQQLINPRVVVFMLWCLFLGIGVGGSWIFLFWLLEDLALAQGCEVVNKIKSIEGLSLAIESFAGEVPFYFLSTWIFKKVKYIHVMTLGLFAQATRFILYSFMSNPWWNLPISVISGIASGICFSVMASYASVVATPGVETTTQGLVSGCYQAGISIGSFIGGVLVGKVGSSFMFKILGIILTCMGFLHVIAQCLLAERKPKKKLN